MINENGIIIKKTNYHRINFVKIITPQHKIDAVIYGTKQINLLYIFNFDLIESNKKNLYIVRKFRLVDKFEHLNTKSKLMAAFFIIDIASQIDIDYNFLVESIRLFEKNNLINNIKLFLEKLLKQHGLYANEEEIEKQLQKLENYLGRKLKVQLNEMFNTES